MDKEKESDLRKEFVMLKAYEVKPNFAFLERKYKLDWRTMYWWKLQRYKYYCYYRGKSKNYSLLLYGSKLKF